MALVGKIEITDGGMENYFQWQILLLSGQFKQFKVLRLPCSNLF